MCSERGLAGITHAPQVLFSEHVAKAPAEVIFYGRDEKYDLTLGSNRVHMGTGGTALTILDLETGAARQTRLRDIFDIGRIVDRLDNIHFYMRPVVPWDIPPEAYDVNSFYACMQATPKHVMCGCNFLEGFEQYIIDDEIIGSAMKALQGITVDEQHLALEVIDQVGPGGNFITADHTMEHMRSEFFQGNGVADRKIRESWQEEGALDARERARRMAHAWLAEPERSYIAEDIDRRIRETFEILL